MSMAEAVVIQSEVAPAADVAQPNPTFEEVCTQAGFQFESHEVVTDDGYHLTMFRIPGLIGENTDGKPPVLL